jgi:alkylated DNA nucleotide flippase Atl1
MIDAGLRLEFFNEYEALTDPVYPEMTAREDGLYTFGGNACAFADCVFPQSPQRRLMEHLYERIYAMVRRIPPGKVTTYGRIAELVGGCTARMVGYAMAALKRGAAPDVPWQRVINAQGKISIHGDGIGNAMQRTLSRGRRRAV